LPANTNLYLENRILNGSFEALNSITVENNVVVYETASLIAGSTIYLKPGFTANSGCNFTASIGEVTDTIQRFYYLKDHLGSIRMTVNSNGEVQGWDDYYPFGVIMPGRSQVYLDAKYRFTGKERDTETGYDYFGARYYDSRIGRWLQVDPLAEKYPWISPFSYTLNNPVRLIDPDGKQVGPPDPFFSYGMGKGFFSALKNSAVGLYETVTNPVESGKQILNAITNPGETLEAMGSAIGDWAGRLTSANPVESGEAFGEAAAFGLEVLIGGKGASKL